MSLLYVYETLQVVIVQLGEFSYMYMYLFVRVSIFSQSLKNIYKNVLNFIIIAISSCHFVSPQWY